MKSISFVIYNCAGSSFSCMEIFISGLANVFKIAVVFGRKQFTELGPAVSISQFNSEDPSSDRNQVENAENGDMSYWKQVGEKETYGATHRNALAHAFLNACFTQFVKSNCLLLCILILGRYIYQFTHQQPLICLYLSHGTDRHTQCNMHVHMLIIYIHKKCTQLFIWQGPVYDQEDFKYNHLLYHVKNGGRQRSRVTTS